MKKNEVVRPTAVKLVELARERHREVEENASKAEEANQKKIDELSVREKELKTEIEAGQKQLKKMIAEFESIEKQTAIKNLEAVKESSSTVEDVKSGKITMNEFYQKGMQDEDVEKAVMLKTQADLETASDAIRSKAVDVVKLELSLSTVQSTVHNLLINPVKSLLSSYVGLTDMLNFQITPLLEEGHSSQNEKVQGEHKMMLIEKGVSVGSGFTWQNITLEEGYRLKLNPIMPKEHVAMLLEQLSGIEASDDKRITVTFRPAGSFFPGDPITVREE